MLPRPLLLALLLLAPPLAAAQAPVVFGPEERGYPTGFSPARVEAAPGASVTFRNDGQFAHTVTFEDGSYDSGPVMPGESATFAAPATPGERRFFCAYHEETGMAGALVVTASPAAATPAPSGPTHPGAAPTTGAPAGEGATPAASSPATTPGAGAALLVLALVGALLLARRR